VGQNEPNTKLKIYDLKKAIDKQAAALIPIESEYKSRTNPKKKLIIIKVILLILIGNVIKKTRQI